MLYLHTLLVSMLVPLVTGMGGPVICYELLEDQRCCMYGPDPKLVDCQVCVDPDGTCCTIVDCVDCADPQITQLMPGGDYILSDIIQTNRTCRYRTNVCPIPCTPGIKTLTRPCEDSAVKEDPDGCPW